MLSCQRSKYCIDTSKKERLLQNLPLWQRDELVEANVCRKSCCSKILSCTPSRLVWQIYSRRPAIKLNCKRKRLEIWLFSFLQNLKSDLRCLQKAIKKRPLLDFEICLFVLIFVLSLNPNLYIVGGQTQHTFMCVRLANQIVTFAVPWGQSVSVWTSALYQRELQMETKIFGGC